MKEIISRNISGLKILILFVLTNLIYAFMLMVSIPEVMSFSDGMKILDMLPVGYSAEYVNSLFTTLGAEGRNAYLFKQIPADMVYPLLFGISYCLILAYFLQKLGKLDGLPVYLCLLPLLAGAFDYIENIGIISMLVNYPDISNLSVTITSIFSISKSVTTTIYFIVLIITIIAFGINRNKKSRSKSGL